MSSQSEQPGRRAGASGLAIPAGLLIGIGVGFIIGNVAAGTLIGLGCGFFIMMVMRAVTGEW